MKKQTHIPLFVTALILLALTVCGSVWDLEITRAVYIGETAETNPFGIIFSYIGIIPTFVGWSFLGASIFCLAKKKIGDTKKRRWLIALAILLFVLSFFYFCNTLYLVNANAFRMHFALAYGVGIATLGGAAYLGYRLSERSKNGELLNRVLFLVAVSLVALLVVSMTKELACRPRFRLVLATGNADCFKSFWQSGRALKESLGAEILTDEFASLPSGHSAYSMFAILLFPALADYAEGLKKHRVSLFALGLVFWAATALSRLTVGAHYLTDVTIAGLVTLLSSAAVSVARKIYLKRAGARARAPKE